MFVSSINGELQTARSWSGWPTCQHKLGLVDTNKANCLHTNRNVHKSFQCNNLAQIVFKTSSSRSSNLQKNEIQSGEGTCEIAAARVSGVVVLDWCFCYTIRVQSTSSAYFTLLVKRRWWSSFFWGHQELEDVQSSSSVWCTWVWEIITRIWQAGRPGLLNYYCSGGIIYLNRSCTIFHQA